MTHRPHSHPARSCVVSALVLALSVTLAACAPAATRTDDANILDSVADHLDESSSAVATAQLAVEAHVAGRLPAVTADATVADAAEAATSAVHGIGTVVLSGDAADRTRDEALEAASGAVGPVAAVRTWLGRSQASPAEVLRALDDASLALDEAHTAVVLASAARTAP